MASFLLILVDACYLGAALLFILGIKRMASPVTARSGIQWAGVGMLLATFATFLTPGLHNLELILIALVLATAVAWISGKKVAMTDMPQMVALYNGLGGGSAAAIGFIELMKFSGNAGETPSQTTLVLAVVGGLIATVQEIPANPGRAVRLDRPDSRDLLLFGAGEILRADAVELNGDAAFLRRSAKDGRVESMALFGTRATLTVDDVVFHADVAAEAVRSAAGWTVVGDGRVELLG